MAKPIEKWEYLLVQSCKEGDSHTTYFAEVSSRIYERDLNKIGEDGWELVSVGWHPNGLMLSAVFKRPV